MNYDMQGITETIPKLFVMRKLTKVEIEKKHQVLIVDKTTGFKGQREEEELQEEQQASCCSSEEAQVWS